MAHPPKKDPVQTRLSRYAKAQLPTKFGVLRCIVFTGKGGVEHVALVKGDVARAESVLCRIHSECLTGEVFGSLKCDCKQQLDLALETIGKAEKGVLLYMRQEGRGIGLGNKIRAYALQDEGLDTVDANRHLGFPDDARDYLEAATMIKDLDIASIILMTNNPAKIDGMEKAGISVVKRLKLSVSPAKEALSYLEVKRNRMGHLDNE